MKNILSILTFIPLLYYKNQIVSATIFNIFFWFSRPDYWAKSWCLRVNAVQYIIDITVQMRRTASEMSDFLLHQEFVVKVPSPIFLLFFKPNYSGIKIQCRT